MPDMSKVRHNDHDNYSTPFEKHRRSEMTVRGPERYGFFRVPTEAVEVPRCLKCFNMVVGGGTVIDGKLLCRKCF